MKKAKLMRLLSSSEEEEVMIEVDGFLYEIEIDHEEETYDGTELESPASFILRPVY